MHQRDLVIRLWQSAEFIKEEVFVEMSITEFIDVKIQIPSALFGSWHVDPMLKIHSVTIGWDRTAGKPRVVTLRIGVVLIVQLQPCQIIPICPAL